MPARLPLVQGQDGFEPSSSAPSWDLPGNCLGKTKVEWLTRVKNACVLKIELCSTLCKAWKPIAICLHTHLEAGKLQQFLGIVDPKKKLSYGGKIKNEWG